MRKSVKILLEILCVAVFAAGLSACHTSKKTVRGSGGVPVRAVDYGEMRSDVKSRHYDIPQIGALIDEAARWLGVPYKYAGNDKKGVDCSGLTSQVFLKILNEKLPRSSREQQQWCANVKKENLQPGDLVFFATGSDRKRVSHVGIYIGNGDIIHASSSRGVIISNLGENYYLKRYHSSGRPYVINKLYASAGKNKGKSKADKLKKAGETIANEKVTSTPAVEVISISVDKLIELHVDSIASVVNDHSGACSVRSASSVIEPQVTQISNEEPTDTVFSQFFD